MENDSHPRMTDEWYRRQAKKRYHDEGVIEIDEGARISQAEGNPDRGAYVQAWVWICDPAAKEDDTEN